MLISLKKLSLALLVSTLVACGGGGGNTFNDDPGGDPGGDPGDPTSDSIFLGSCTDGVFTDGVLVVEDDPLTGGSTNVRGNLVLDDDCSTPLTTAASVIFFSTCSLEDEATLDSPVATVFGKATSVYTETGCDPTDTVTATATIGGAELSAEATFAVSSGGSTPTGVSIGNCAPDGTFTEGVLAVSVSPATLSSGGTAGFRANLVLDDDCSTPYTVNTSVEFFSGCSLADDATLTSPVSTDLGKATSTYTATGCESPPDDTVTARAEVDGTELLATADIEILPADIGSVEYVSTTPSSLIAIKGTGGFALSETANVVFQVFDNAGAPDAGRLVSFELSNTLGGISLSDTSGTTDFDGKVSVVVSSGTVHTSVRVKATITGSSPEIFTQSDELTITTGIPDQNSFSLSIETFNTNSYGHDGVRVPVTIQSADHFNNPVPDGTAVSVTTEIGAFIDGVCLTTAGICTVDWVSNGERPHDGRVSFHATVLGDESFFDANGNGVFDDDGPALDEFDDLPEVFLDNDEDGVLDGPGSLTAIEEFLDVNENGIWNTPNGLYNGVLCEHSTDCATGAPGDPTLIHVRAHGVHVMGSEEQVIHLTPPDPAFGTSIEPATCEDALLFTVDPTSGFAPQSAVCIDAFEDIFLPSSGSTVNVQIRTWDIRGQVPPAGSSVSVEAQDAGEIVFTTAGAVADTLSHGPYFDTLLLRASDNGELDTGLLIVTVTVGGIETVRLVNLVEFDDEAPTVTAVSPTSGSDDIALDASIKVTFSEPMDTATFTCANFIIDTFPTTPTNLCTAVSSNPEGTIATVLHSGLAASTTYEVTVTGPGGVTDIASPPNELASDFVWFFSTEAP